MVQAVRAFLRTTLAERKRILMRNAGVYLSGGLYLERAGKYYGRRIRKKKWGQRAKRAGIAFLLAAAVTAGAVKTAETVSGAMMKTAETGAGAMGTAGTMSGAAKAFAAVQKAAAEAEPKEAAYFPNVPGSVTKDAKDTLVILDPGHGGEDEGCARDGIQEKDVNLQIALAVRTKLAKKGYQVRLTRESDVSLSLADRVKVANEAGADIYVSIHQNASDASEAQGIEVLYSVQNEGEASRRLARLIQKYAAQNTGAAERAQLLEEELHVIRECTMPSCLVETGFLSNAAEREKLTEPAYQEQMAEGIVSGIELYFHPKTMYLTFDDGPSEENTSAVLDILKARDIKATFFVVGENVRKHPEVARRIAEEGHTIGIHCNRHEYDKLYADVDSYLKDFEEAYAAVKEVTGAEPKLFRFPGGSINSYNRGVYEEMIDAMTERGFIYYDWNASLEDAVTKAEPEVLIRNAVSSTLERKNVVMLAHDIVYQTAQCLDELIEQFPEYRMEALTEEVDPIQF